MDEKNGKASSRYVQVI